MGEKQIYQAALDQWGAQAQIIMVCEEMAELQKELCKNLRGKGDRIHIAEEIADVEIMVEQMKLLFEIDDDVKYFKEMKLERVKSMLKLEGNSGQKT